MADPERTISEDRADRLEAKVDGLIQAVNRLAVIDERQIQSGQRIGQLEDRVAKCEARIDSTDRKVDTWINRGLGAWAIVVTLFALYQTIAPLIHKP